MAQAQTSNTEPARPIPIAIVHRDGAVALQGIALSGHQPLDHSVDIALTASAKGFVTVDRDGATSSAGDALALGRATPPRKNTDAVAIALTPLGTGGYVAFCDGTLTLLGTAPSLSLAASQPNKKGSCNSWADAVVDLALTPSGSGGWMVRSDGTLTSFGSAPPLGPVGPGSPIVGIASTPSGAGAWVARSDGTVHALGDAATGRSPGARKDPDVTGIARSGDRWVIVDKKGGVEIQGEARVTFADNDGAAVAIDVGHAGFLITPPGVPLTTKVIPDNGVLDIVGDVSGQLLVRLPSAASQGPIALRPGDVLAAGISAVTPNGLLRRVLSLSQQPDGTVVAVTRPATLSDALPAGQFSFSDPLETPIAAPNAGAALRTASGSEAAGSTGSARAADAQVQASAVGPAQCGGSQGITFEPTIDAIDPDLIGDVSWNETEFATKLGVRTTLRGSLKMRASLAVACEVTVPFVNYHGQTRVFTVFGLPVVVQPIFNIDATLRGAVETAVEATLSFDETREVTLQVTVPRDGDATTSTNEQINRTVNLDSPLPQGTFSISQNVRTSFSLLFYGVVAPRGEVAGTLSGKFEPCKTPDLSVEVNIAAKLGIYPANWISDALKEATRIELSVEKEYPVAGYPRTILSRQLFPPESCIQTVDLPPATRFAPYSQQLVIPASGTSPPTYALATGSALPPGLSLSTDAVLSGSPTATGLYSFTVEALAGSVRVGAVRFSVAVTDRALEITTTAIPPAYVGRLYSTQLRANRPIGELTWRLVEGGLPPEFSLSTTGVLSGTAAELFEAEYRIRVEVTERATGQVRAANLVLNLNTEIGSVPLLLNGFQRSLFAGSHIRADGSVSVLYENPPSTFRLASFDAIGEKQYDVALPIEGWYSLYRAVDGSTVVIGAYTMYRYSSTGSVLWAKPTPMSSRFTPHGSSPLPEPVGYSTFLDVSTIVELGDGRLAVGGAARTSVTYCHDDEGDIFGPTEGIYNFAIPVGFILDGDGNSSDEFATRPVTDFLVPGCTDTLPALSDAISSAHRGEDGRAFWVIRNIDPSANEYWIRENNVTSVATKAAVDAKISAALPELRLEYTERGLSVLRRDGTVLANRIDPISLAEDYAIASVALSPGGQWFIVVLEEDLVRGDAVRRVVLNGDLTDP